MTTLEGGFISLHRRILTSAVWMLPDAQFKVFIALLLSANWRDSEVLIFGMPRVVRRGQVLLAQRKMATLCGVGRGAVSRCIDALARLDMIRTEAAIPDHKSSHNPTIVTICNYDKYQSSSLEADPKCEPGADRERTVSRAYPIKEEGKKGRRRASLASLAPLFAAGAAPGTSGVLDRILDLWNQVCVPAGFARARWTSNRSCLAKACMRDESWWDAFEAACAYVVADPFYRGAGKGGWVMTLDWLLRPGKAQELAEKAGTTRANGAAGNGVSRVIANAGTAEEIKEWRNCPTRTSARSSGKSASEERPDVPIPSTSGTGTLSSLGSPDMTTPR